MECSSIQESKKRQLSEALLTNLLFIFTGCRQWQSGKKEELWARWRPYRGVINQSPYPDWRQSTADIKDLSCQRCSAAPQHRRKGGWRERTEGRGGDDVMKWYENRFSGFRVIYPQDSFSYLSCLPNHIQVTVWLWTSFEGLHIRSSLIWISPVFNGQVVVVRAGYKYKWIKAGRRSEAANFCICEPRTFSQSSFTGRKTCRAPPARKHESFRGTAGTLGSALRSELCSRTRPEHQQKTLKRPLQENTQTHLTAASSLWKTALEEPNLHQTGREEKADSPVSTGGRLMPPSGSGSVLIDDVTEDGNSRLNF